MSDVRHSAQDLLKSLQREINGLSDSNFKIRTQSLTTLKEVLIDAKPPLKQCKLYKDVVQEVLSEIAKPLLKEFSDIKEKCRELSINIFKE